MQIGNWRMKPVTLYELMFADYILVASKLARKTKKEPNKQN